ncbi:hypothetical protein FTZ77_22770 [Salmonella enterica]|nr:hypothetical protein [Salmonella enterica]EDU1817410.1 hypothetical protein [Salmonella enterica subsp. enterica serovar Sandiego]EAU2299081.1 hypothetical protein [Salmonella enterica]EAU5653502.1 hypothetical protein [Salmonella enterica]EAV6214526.1 hypothetical protein [Salmonella enterica]
MSAVALILTIDALYALKDVKDIKWKTAVTEDDKRQKHYHRVDAVRPCHANTLGTTGLHHVRNTANLT